MRQVRLSLSLSWSSETTSFGFCSEIVGVPVTEVVAVSFQWQRIIASWLNPLTKTADVANGPLILRRYVRVIVCELPVAAAIDAGAARLVRDMP